MTETLVVSDERVERSILLIRGRKVMLDADLAELYGVPTKVLNQAIKRNWQRFPQDFMFQLDEQEVASMRSQSVTASDGTASRRNIRYLPYAFSEHGVIMAASVLNTQRAMEMSVYVVRAFVRLRELVGANKEIIAKLDQLERRIVGHDKAIISLFDAIRQLMKIEDKGRKAIGFQVEEDAAAYL